MEPWEENKLEYRCNGEVEIEDERDFGGGKTGGSDWSNSETSLFSWNR